MDVKQTVLEAFGMRVEIYFELMGRIFENRMNNLRGKHRRA